ncbi:MAG: zinc ABC transporter substrate-binding protein [Thermodesulfobacteriota bacterium]|nr:zinc ABC transporter substrate-binding protein [Thermodesulfobacteriota bacterium]
MKGYFLLIIGIVFCFLSITGLAGLNAAEPVSVFVSIVPQKYFVESIGGNLVEVSVMVKPGVNPATYEPKPKQMVSLSKARIYFAVGVPFEKSWLERIASTNTDMLVVNTGVGIKKRSMRAHNHYNGKSRHCKEEKKYGIHQEIKDPHIWLSPPLVILQARNILQTLVKIDPNHSTVYQSNYRKFIDEIVQLDVELMTLFGEIKQGIEFMVFHPAWGYFAQTYGIKQVPVEIEGKEPKPAELKNLIQYAKAKKIKVVFVQPQFSTQSAQTIAGAIQGHIVVANPLAPDWADNLRRVATMFKAALK